MRDKVLKDIDRIVRAEALASGAAKEPLVEPMASGHLAGQAGRLGEIGPPSRT